MSFKRFRIGLLLLVLAVVALSTWLTKVRSTDWDHSLWVAVYPINGDGSDAAERYIQTLTEDTFEPIDRFFTREAKRFGVTLKQPVITRLGARIGERPPAPPRAGNVFQVMWWSLELRRWASRFGGETRPPPDVKIFAIFYDPERNPTLAHSLGLEKGLIGVANLFASDRDAGGNLVVVAHELLHTLGATDKYDPRTGLPIFPDGFADPAASPRYPQRAAELMGGRVPISPSEARIPRSFAIVTIGDTTAAEINWPRGQGSGG